MPEATESKRRLLLVDGSSYLYRAFFAGGEAMSTTLPDGTVQKTGAIRIMINMMQKLLKDYPSTWAACVFDAKGPTFRDALYPAYKQQPGQVLHELQVVGQLLEAQALEHGEHVLFGGAVAFAGDEVVGVLDPALDAAQVGQHAQVQAFDEGSGFGKRDFGVDGHGGKRRRDQKSSRRQRLLPLLPLRAALGSSPPVAGATS